MVLAGLGEKGLRYMYIYSGHLIIMSSEWEKASDVTTLKCPSKTDTHLVQKINNNY